ncbi:MAG: hypothetical protein ABIH34_00720 [Nanoarchaeota archaeon]
MADLSFSSLFAESWMTFKKKFAILFSLAFVFSILPTVLYFIYSITRTQPVFDEVSSFLDIFSILWQELVKIAPFYLGLFLLGMVFTLSAIYVLVMDRQKRQLSFGEAIGGVMPFFFSAILLTIIVALILIPSFLFFIIPGVILSVYFTFAIYALIAENNGPVEAIKASYHAVKGSWWLVFAYALLIGLIIGGISMAMGMIFMIPSFILASSGVENQLFEIIQNAVMTCITSCFTLFSIIFMEKFYMQLKAGKQTKNSTVTHR